MENANPILKKLLLAAFVLYIIMTVVMLADLQYRVGIMEHKMMHVTGTRAVH